LLNISRQAHFGEALQFFLYDSIKIILLLFAMISVVGFTRSFLSASRIKRWLTRRGIIGNLLASLFGAVTPFCSCSSIPIFLGCIEAGIPLGVAFSFLITSPIINEYLAVLMLGFFGWKIALAYVSSGILIGVACGLILGKMRLERYLAEDMLLFYSQSLSVDVEYRGIKQRIIFGLREAIGIVKSIWLWILVGVGIGALIHNYVPQEAVQKIVSRGGAFSVPVAVLLGVPIYGSCAAIVPIAVALFQKGFPLGTALAFMMAVAALSLPEAIMLKRAMKLKLLAIFFSITALGIVITGYIFNILQKVLI